MTTIPNSDNRDGLCQACGTAIPLALLQERPMTRWCESCQPSKTTPVALDIVDEWGRGSFPASDPPANW